ncbi:MAG: 2-oxoglutarate dehydrogenase E1 component [Reyranella sp.]|uniref:2-oxoglutarate dehydrogenase E1 component n=1 Tax=Reyranella sp. TaxID=1929291 RepID=UPI0011F40AA2|nr:2-oxoglutarate dehydrogenase E1 component [Reyranella sp.]TAJ94782.1 MAG: 2-oxoglutarate dehydrogenase E1 component [Reyranella sp.]TBR21296.1 MAG: 2-oxoglutarate dehydrogenase E1 component [Reyranella sp.]
MRAEQTSFLFGANAPFIEELYARFLADPNSVDAEWQTFFGALAEQKGDVLAEVRGASWAPNGARVIGAVDPDAVPAAANRNVKVGKAAAEAAPAAPAIAGKTQEEIRAAAQDTARALMMIRAYRIRGHLEADLDPLGLVRQAPHRELDPATYGFTDADWDRPILIFGSLALGESATLRQIMERLRKTYCGKIGVEFMHISDPDQKAWIQERIEHIENQTEFTVTGRKMILERVGEAEGLERYLHVKFVGTKRFGLDGGESLIPGIEQILKRGGQLGVKEVMLGMPHRGRLNTLVHVMHKSYTALFSEFQGRSSQPEEMRGSGDVKYHLGASADREFDGNVIHLSLSPNPSHLEAVNPVILGKARAKEDQRGDTDRSQVMCILMHGDAAFAGQGLVAESLDLSDLAGYRIGGTIHFVVNNQIGFTTLPTESRSGPYCTEVAKIVQAPILHVNGDDPEAVVHVSRIATEFRQHFKRDIVIDMFCYRRHGHNEGDEPMFTQPLMYKEIGAHRSVKEIYAAKLEAEGVVTADEVAAMDNALRERLDKGLEAASNYKPNKADWLEGKWAGITVAPGEEDRKGVTAVELDKLRAVGRAISEPPKNFELNRKIVRQLQEKRKTIDTGENIDWATGEALAFGTLLSEGTPVRLSGQDSGRGTFSQRHSVLVDQLTEAKYVPLNHVADGQARYEVIDSPLNEAGVLGFEYGYSLAEPNALVLWEAQFGDFANGAQVIIDQFICSGESKWLRMSGLVMLLPHGYEGQGPEHSSARLERYLQLSAEDNWQVINPTTPANYFHALRRQMRRTFRKPLVVMTPKSLLRHKDCVSTLADFGPGSSFRRILAETDQLVDGAKVRRVVLCSGKVYFDLVAERRKRKIDDIAILRIEQLYPFPFTRLGVRLAQYPNAEVVWCQEEPENMGAWHFVDRRIERALTTIEGKAKRPLYVGRAEAASPATGSARNHLKEQADLVDRALTVG